MALGSGTNEPVNHWRPVHQRVREFEGLLSGSGGEHIRSRPGPGFSVSEQRIGPAGRERRNPLESTENANARPDAWSGVRVNRNGRSHSEIKNGSGGRIRTYDQVINSHLRYHCATPEQMVRYGMRTVWVSQVSRTFRPFFPFPRHGTPRRPRLSCRGNDPGESRSPSMHFRNYIGARVSNRARNNPGEN